MQPAEICEKILSLRDEGAVQERVINELVKEMIGLQTEKFEGTINLYIKDHGIEKQLKRLFFFFLERIGILWQKRATTCLPRSILCPI